MNILNESDIHYIAKQYNLDKVRSWCLEKYSDQLLGYLGDHLRLKISAQNAEGVIKKIICFVKCMPQSDPTKAKLIKECNFFTKEYAMLSELFPKLGSNEGENQWYPKSLLLKENVFVSEDVVVKGFEILHTTRTKMTYEETKSVVENIAKLNAQCYIYEENKSKDLNTPYRLWDDYSNYLREPKGSLAWRNAGKNAVIHYLRVFSKYRTHPKFSDKLENAITELFSLALEQFQPSSKYRNALCHRDLWSNNLFFKKREDGKILNLIIDFQTVLYAMPMIDLSSLLYFNTSKEFREMHTKSLLNFYYETLEAELRKDNINVIEIIDKESLLKAYDEYTLFGIIQAAIIVPIIMLKNEDRIKYFNDPKTFNEVNNVCRNEVFVKIAESDEYYRCRLTELLDEIVEKYVIS